MNSPSEQFEQSLIPVRWIDTNPVESTDKPCTIGSLDVRVRVSGLYADVVQTLVIQNPNDRDMSVTLSILMPDGAVVCGYALDIDGQMIDGVVVPKERARVAFETEQRRGADPGLVEAVKGNVYQTRVYPVGRLATRTVRLRYTAPLLLIDGRDALLDLPMPEVRLAKRSICVEVEMLDAPKPVISGVSGAQFKESGVFWHAESEEEDVLADTGVRVALPQLPDSFAIVERDGEGTLWFVASERAAAESTSEVPRLDTLTVLWDTSGSRASVDHAAEIELVRSYCAEARRIRLITFGDSVDAAIECESADELVERIGELRYDGATDYEALSHALSVEANAGEGSVCVLFTDGMGTMGDAPEKLVGDCRIAAIISGSTRDAEYLKQACAGCVFDIATAPKSSGELAARVLCPNVLLGVKGQGVSDVLGIGSGQDGRYTAIGVLDADETTVVFENTRTSFQLAGLDAKGGGTLARAWAAMRAAQLSARADENVEELLALGRRFGIVSSASSLLVLESLDQWLRYEIEPPETWPEMHQEWERHVSGIMKHSSEQGLRDDHIRMLKGAWAELRRWWERDFSSTSPATGAMFCTACGASISAGSRFCSQCGSPISPGREPIDQPVDGLVVDDGVPMEPASGSMARMAGSLVPMAMEDCGAVDAADAVIDEDGSESAGSSASATASVNVQAWMPDAEYLAALDDALRTGLDAAHDAYFREREKHAVSPSFFIDCAGWFIANGDKSFGLRVLSNLAEMRIEDAAMLRVMAWRMREAGELERALSILRRVLKLRPEDSQSHRDVALVLDELARRAYGEGNQAAACAYAEESGEFYREIARTPWQRRAQAVSLFAVEEYNVLRAWASAQAWDVEPQLESLGEELEGVLDCDLRVTLAWDADETDIDLHVTEPGGEEAYYANRLTHAGGRVSEDITDGYGPELYEIRRAQDGEYVIRAHYFASHQQAIFGPASCTLTVYTDWGRPTQKQVITSTRLENEREMIHVGVAAYAR